MIWQRTICFSALPNHYRHLIRPWHKSKLVMWEAPVWNKTIIISSYHVSCISRLLHSWTLTYFECIARLNIFKCYEIIVILNCNAPTYQTRRSVKTHNPLPTTLACRIIVLSASPEKRLQCFPCNLTPDSTRELLIGVCVGKQISQCSQLLSQRALLLWDTQIMYTQYWNSSAHLLQLFLLLYI